MIIVDRTNIGILGKVNAGKSTIMNLLTMQETSIVDPTPGTTADVKSTVLEIHDFGPVKLFDTAGLNELTKLGEKKRLKAVQTLKECDIILLVVDPIYSLKSNDFTTENQIISLGRQYGKQILLIYNIFTNKLKEKKKIEEFIVSCKEKIYLSNSLKTLVLDAQDRNASAALISFIEQNAIKNTNKVELFPFLKENGFVAMNIPVDEETPEGRLLRPQNVVLDYLLRRFIPFAGFRMDLTKARSSIKEIAEEEKQKYLDFIDQLMEKNNLQLIITDSQAIDIVDEWTTKEIPITTFSITMINFQSKGNLRRFVEGLKVVDSIKEGDKIIIAEACNHDRKCNDIGTVQIPDRLEKYLGFRPKIEFNFGREFPLNEELNKYKILIHCGGCMIDSQKINARMSDLEKVNIPITNYGILLSYLHSKQALKRVLAPWGIIIEEE